MRLVRTVAAARHPGRPTLAHKLRALAQRMGPPALQPSCRLAEKSQCVAGACARPIHPALEDFAVSKYELIDHIRRINTSAAPEFLATFSEEDLRAYFGQLQELQHELAQRHQPRPSRREEAEPALAGLA